ncbi:NADPH:quinone oxidoreductase family protein [Microvirga brassicacearum]|uniref:NADPH:quinone oxidoreductase family protein n=1 Tax=Microvirga brassicacearum TaxID=2580413 RepID=A0A5N3PCJ6_9HYPH|nr:NADPH:quinone oxidoreductase family protein [Microvirga brassicacearum]KAB0267468.1 NADPH:quinone oxidoreductase family protein [Microvirga brassicacearum]
MRAVLCRDFGPRAELRIEDVAAPIPREDEVLIAVEACGVNFFDGLVVEGKYQTRPDRPFSPGSEVAGVVTAVGERVTAIAPGMRVLGFAGFGGYAEQAIVPAPHVFPIPDEMSFVEAAGFLITYGTSHHALKDRAQITPGETLLILGAAGGVGLTAVELGKCMGARVIAAASSVEKLALCRTYGADETINYSSEDLRQRVKDITGGRGVDVIYDPVGGSMTETALRSLALFGRHLVIGFAAGDIPKIPLNLLLLKQSSLIGVFWGAHARAAPAKNAGNIAELLRWFAEGKLKPHIFASYPIDRFSEALDLVMERGVQGKVVLTTADSRTHKGNASS